MDDTEIVELEKESEKEDKKEKESEKKKENITDSSFSLCSLDIDFLVNNFPNIILLNEDFIEILLPPPDLA